MGQRWGVRRADLGRVRLSKMTGYLKTFLLWLLIAALPVQGFAAASQRSCGSVQVVTSLVVSAAGAHDESAQSTHMAMDQHESMAHDGSDCDACDNESASSIYKVSGIHHAKHGSCSFCASCCIGASGPPRLLHFSFFFDFPEAHHLPGSHPIVGFIPDGLERPPRHLAA